MATTTNTETTKRLVTCPECDGSGVVTLRDEAAYARLSDRSRWETPPSDYDYDAECVRCDGTGEVEDEDEED